jgi:hypothetical protein
MMAKREIQDWLKTLPEESHIAVDDGGLCLVCVESGPEGATDAEEFSEYLEIGGVPDEEDVEVAEDQP